MNNFLQIKVVKQHEETRKQFLNLTLIAKNSPFGPQKAQNYPDLGQKQKLESKEAQKIKKKIHE